jgi:hypothetical protein
MFWFNEISISGNFPVTRLCTRFPVSVYCHVPCFLKKISFSEDFCNVVGTKRLFSEAHPMKNIFAVAFLQWWHKVPVQRLQSMGCVCWAADYVFTWLSVVSSITHIYPYYNYNCNYNAINHKQNRKTCGCFSFLHEILRDPCEQRCLCPVWRTTCTQWVRRGSFYNRFLRIYSEEIIVVTVVTVIEDPRSIAVREPTRRFPFKPNTWGNLSLCYVESRLIVVTYTIWHI